MDIISEMGGGMMEKGVKEVSDGHARMAPVHAGMKWVWWLGKVVRGIAVKNASLAISDLT